MNKKSIPGAKSMKMSADDLKEMVKQAVKECLGDEEKDLTEQDDPTLNEGIMEVIEAAVEAATEKRKARKEAGEEVSEDLTADEVLAEAAKCATQYRPAENAFHPDSVLLKSV